VAALEIGNLYTGGHVSCSEGDSQLYSAFTQIRSVAAFRAVVLWLPLIAACHVATANAQEGLEKVISLNVTKDTELSVIFGTIAKISNTNIVLDPKVRSKMSLNLRDISALDAMRVVASINGLKIGKLGNVYVVGQPETVKNVLGRGRIQVRQLGYAKAEDIANIINQTLSEDVTAQHYAPTNSVILTPK